MKKTLRQVRLELDDLSSDIYKKENEVKRNALRVIHRVPGGQQEAISMPFDFDGEYKALEKMYADRIKLETAVQEANAMTKYNGKSLVEIIREINVLKSKLSTISSLADNVPYNRRVDVGTNGSFYYEEGAKRSGRDIGYCHAECRRTDGGYFSFSSYKTAEAL